jgi:hypothetical protein
MSPVAFEPTISAGERPRTYALDSAASGTGYHQYLLIKDPSSFGLHFGSLINKYIFLNSTLLCLWPKRRWAGHVARMGVGSVQGFGGEV